MKYRDYILTRAEKPNGTEIELKWVFYHRELNGPDDHRQGHRLTIEEAKDEIDKLYELIENKP
jgi:hypothetical protein